MKNILVKILIGTFALVVVIFIGRDLIIKSSITGLAHAATGLNIKVGGFNSSIGSSSMTIKDLRVFNPAGYTEKTMLTMPEIFVQVELGTILTSRRRIKEMRLDVSTMIIERNNKGRLNLEELKPAGSKKEGGEAKTAPTKESRLHINLLRLRIGKVVYKDSFKTPPSTQEFDLNIDETYRNIDDVRALMPIIISNALKSQGLRALTNFSPADLIKNFKAAGINVSDLGLNQISGMLDSSLGQSAQEVISSVVDNLSSLFGKS